MTDYKKTTVGSGYNTAAALNTELSAIETAIATKLDASGGVLSGDLDFGGNNLLNIADGISNQDPVTVKQLAAASIVSNVTTAALTSYTPSGGSATTIAAKLDEIVSVKDFGAVGNGTTDDKASIQLALTAAGTIVFPRGTYRLDSALSLSSNTHLIFQAGAVLNYTDSITANGLVGTSLTNITFTNMVMNGSGVASGFSNIFLTSCTNVTFENCTITRAGSMAINLLTCSFVKVHGCNLSNNYFYGVNDKGGSNNKYTNNLFNQNGITGTATSSGGRGIHIWECNGIVVSGNRFILNNEYGFRFYSETADSGITEGCSLHHNYFEDNTGCDILMYDESESGSRLFRNVVDSNVVYRTTNATLGTSILVEGTSTRISNTHHHHEGTQGTYTAFNMFHAVDSSIVNCSCRNTVNALSFSNTDDCTVSNFQGYSVAKAVSGVTTKGITLHNCYFSHGGNGTSDEAVNNTNASGINTYDQVTFDGFHTGIRINDIAVKIYRCRSINSTFAGIRKTTNLTSLVELSGNQWDIAAPTELSQMESSKSAFGNSVTRFASAPVNLFWQIGDEVINSAPSVGQPKSWKCTVAGTGSGVGGGSTFISTGNL